MELPHDVTRWLERHKMIREREDRTPTGKNERKKKTWKSSAKNHKRVKSRKGLMMDMAGEQENLDRKPSQRLHCEENQDSQDSQEDSQDEDPAETCSMLPMSEDEGISSPKSILTKFNRGALDRLQPLQPKKRWLRNACLEQQLDQNTSPNTYTSVYKINEKQVLTGSTESSELHLYASVDNSVVNNVYVPSTDHDIKSNIKLEPFVSQITWDMNCNNKSLKPEKDVYKMTQSLNQSQEWEYRDLEYSLPSCQSIYEPSINESTYGRVQDPESVHSSCFDYPTEQISRTVMTKQDTLAVASPHISENETRPTVLMLVGSSNSCKEIVAKPSAVTDICRTGATTATVDQEDNMTKLPLQEDNQKWQGALALMELAKAQKKARNLDPRQDDESIVNSDLPS